MMKNAGKAVNARISCRTIGCGSAMLVDQGAAGVADLPPGTHERKRARESSHACQLADPPAAEARRRDREDSERKREKCFRGLFVLVQRSVSDDVLDALFPPFPRVPTSCSTGWKRSFPHTS